MSSPDRNPLRRPFARHRRRRAQRELADRKLERARAIPPREDLSRHGLDDLGGAALAPDDQNIKSQPSTSLALRESMLPAASSGARAVGWDLDAPASEFENTSAPGLTSQILALLAEPGVNGVTAARAAHVLAQPRQDVLNTLEALVNAGELEANGPTDGPTTRFIVPVERKLQLESMYREAAHELGETTALARRPGEDLLVLEDEEEPRLPVTAGLLSVFLPGTGQLLNGDVGRASLVFAVWSLALLTNLPPIWTFVCLYAGAEAFFTAKVRGMERKLALEAAASGGDKQPKPSTP